MKCFNDKNDNLLRITIHCVPSTGPKYQGTMENVINISLASH